ncbi:MAG: zinc-ribbon domain-containing protein [Candidatus Bathyarchaeota archaeon]|nr:zinc-ribbon domain-containing protein [Candidatus Bathyarchaeota archaeon]MDH5495279.1 zinc-ribbon domain-containing protein [Candidatus Bathyarchaeota archaeon]
MPYCAKCGAELEKDAKFCPNCGTAVGSLMTEPERRRKGIRPINTLAIILIALIVAAVVITTIALAPVRTVGPVTKRMSAPYKSDVNTLNLNLTADVARVDIVFENLSDEWQSPSIILNVSATARVGVFGSSDFLERYMPVWQNTTVGDVLAVTVKQEVDNVHWPWYSSLNVTFLIRIDPSMNTSLNIKTSIGGVVLGTQETGVVLNSLSLEATTGGVEANLVGPAIVAGDVSLKTTTGGVKLSWNNVIVVNDIEVNGTTVTGGVEMNVKQHGNLLGNITLKAEAITGGVDFAVDIKGDIGAKIESSVTTGGIDVDRQVGFSGTEISLQSSNYPASYNFDVTLKTTTGGIDIDAKYTP